MAHRPPAGAEGTWLPIGEAHRLAGVSRRSAYRWAKSGRIPTRTEGGTTLVTVEALRAEASRPRCATVAHALPRVAPVSPPNATSGDFDPPDAFFGHLISRHDEQLQQHEDDIAGILSRITELERKVLGHSRAGERRAPARTSLMPGTLKPPVLPKKRGRGR